MKFNRTISASIALFLSLALVACSQSQVTVTLDLIVTAADAAVTTLQATGTVPPGTAVLVEGYLKSVTTAVDFTTTELASTDTGGVKAARIAAEFAAIAIPDLPVGTPQVIASVVNAVAQSVIAFVDTLPTLNALDTLKIQVYMNSFAGSEHVKIAKRQLSHIKKHNAKVAAKIG